MFVLKVNDLFQFSINMQLKLKEREGEAIDSGMTN